MCGFPTLEYVVNGMMAVLCVLGMSVIYMLSRGTEAREEVEVEEVAESVDMELVRRTSEGTGWDDSSRSSGSWSVKPLAEKDMVRMA